MVATRAAVDRDGPGSSPAPLCAKECWACAAPRSTEPGHCQGGDGVLRDVRGLRCGGRWPATASRGGGTAGQGSAVVPTPCLDLPVPQVVDDIDQILLRTVEQTCAKFIFEHVIVGAPKIPPQERIRVRAVLRAPQMGDELVVECRRSSLTQCFLLHFLRGVGLLLRQGLRFVQQNIKVFKVFSLDRVR